ncbi:MAG: hypothetical protein DMD42_13015, partial [Gemmatimonadetes bacterium]
TIERTVDKLWTTALLEQAGLRVPETVVCESPDAALAAFRALGDVIVKPLFGSMGLGMVRVTDEEMAFRVFRTLETLRGVYYVQQTIDHAGCDVRAFVVGGRVIGAIERSAPGWKTNLARGGRARAVTLTSAQTELALAAARAVRADYAGVDLLPARDGTVYVVEVNARPAPQAADVAAAAQLACLLEASAPKPGNVSPFASFRDTTYEDFLASAAAIGPALALAGERALGATIRAAVEATARWAPSNTNLGLVLLLAPLARAELRPGPGTLRARLTGTLADTTVADARDAYVAIRSAAPGGLGRASEQDVAGTPTVTLREAMALARDRDAIAREYASDFETTFEIGAPGLRRALSDRLAWRDAIVEVYLTLLAASPDTLIVRKLGTDAGVTVQRRARAVVDAGGVRTMAGRDAIAALDRELRDEANTLNPGATADLTGAAIYVVLLEGGWHGRP